MAGKSTAEVLSEAADICERGWCQGKFVKDGCVCASEAIRIAGDSELALDTEAWPFFNRHIGADYVSEWNDAPGRTQAEVVAKLREAAALAKAEGR